MKKNLLNTPVTKLEMDERFDIVDKKFEEQDEKARGYRDEVLNKLDGVISELENIRLDRELAVHQTQDHEERITKIEKHLHFD